MPARDALDISGKIHLCKIYYNLRFVVRLIHKGCTLMQLLGDSEFALGQYPCVSEFTACDVKLTVDHSLQGNCLFTSSSSAHCLLHSIKCQLNIYGTANCTSRSRKTQLNNLYLYFGHQFIIKQGGFQQKL